MTDMLQSNDVSLIISRIDDLSNRVEKLDTRLENVNSHVMQIPGFINQGIERHEARCIVRQKTEVGPVSKNNTWMTILKIALPLILSGGIMGAIGFQCSLSKAAASQTQTQNDKD